MEKIVLVVGGKGTFNKDGIINVLESRYSEVISVSDEAVMINYLQNRIPDVVVMEPLLPEAFLINPKEVQYCSVENGAVGLNLFGKMRKLTRDFTVKKSR